jgi:hypothetical protein
LNPSARADQQAQGAEHAGQPEGSRPAAQGTLINKLLQ